MNLLKIPCDCHLHTDNSFDSETPAALQVARARELGIPYIALTDHCDILEWSDANIARSNAQAMELNALYDDITVLRGIELGEPLQDMDETSRALGLCEYDFVLCSLHNIQGEEDFYYLHPDRSQAAELVRRYFEELLEMVKWNQFDSLAHLTYPLRYITERDGVPVDMTPYLPIIREILATLAANGKALEINTSGLRNPDGMLLPTGDYVELFRRLGGRYITLGSDAHTPEHLAVGMAEGIAAAKEAGFTAVTVFINRQPVEIPFA
ncbi:MAG: histidinol-phosphatase HisJ family protein [Clostridia bacterium]|nr:histidinol-phosphatase HisJ family protein [Clostridia bacterium]